MLCLLQKLVNNPLTYLTLTKNIINTWYVLVIHESGQRSDIMDTSQHPTSNDQMTTPSCCGEERHYTGVNIFPRGVWTCCW